MLQPLPTPDFYDFLCFAKSKPADEEYKYLSTINCPFAQYLDDREIPFASVAGTYWRSAAAPDTEIPFPTDHMANALAFGENTWGALVRRLAASHSEIIARVEAVADVLFDADERGWTAYDRAIRDRVPGVTDDEIAWGWTLRDLQKRGIERR